MWRMGRLDYRADSGPTWSEFMEGYMWGMGLFLLFFRFEVWDASRVKFWTNCWCVDRSLKDLFSDLFALAVDKEASVASYLGNLYEGEDWHWNPQLIQFFQNWELESVDSFFEVPYANIPSSPSQGTVLRKPYISFPWKSICLAKVPQNVVFLTWTATLEKILIIEKLRWRHILIVDWFCMWKSSGESIDHLFLHLFHGFRYMVLRLLLVWANLGDAEIYGWGVRVSCIFLS